MNDDADLRLLRRQVRATLSTAQLERLRARLLADFAAPPPRARNAWIFAAAAAALLVGVGIGVLVRPREGRDLSARACELLPLPSRAREQLASLGPGAVGRDGCPIALRSGSLLVRTDGEPLAVRSVAAEVLVRPRSLVEVTVESWGVAVAAYSGSAEVRWSETALSETVNAGSAITAGGPIALDAARAQSVASWLSGAAAPSLCSSATATAASAPEAREGAPPEPHQAPPTPEVREGAPPEPHQAPPTPRPLAPRRARVPETAPMVRESRLLAAAQTALRREHDTDGALRLLDQHQRQFPDGALLAEAGSLRLDALLAARRWPAALALLDGIDVAATPRAGELYLLRGELRAGAARCAEASGDFTAALERVGPALRERALAGRRACQP